MNEFDVIYNVDLKKYNTYGIGGKSKYLIKPRNLEELENVIKYLKDNSISWHIIGSGSNIILPDDDYDGAIIKLDYINELLIEDDFAYAGAGENLNSLIKKLLDMGYVNLATLYGIPGTLGGALIGNAGANNKEIYDDILSITIYDNGEFKTINKENITYSYRNTEFKNKQNIIVLGATIKLEKGDSKAAWDMIKSNLENRKNKQPLEYKNAGSVFKNPKLESAGKLIEECNLKGYKINDAMVSLKHANFIINLKNATSHDIIELIEYIKNKVKEEKGIELELEQIIFKW